LRVSFEARRKIFGEAQASAGAGAYFLEIGVGIFSVVSSNFFQ